jgi:D-3-phosphoglycerate dehydrogenase
MSNVTDKPRVLSQLALLPEAMSVLEPLVELQVGPIEDSDAWYAGAAGYDALILGGNTVMDGPRMDRIGSRLRALVRPGIGVDRIDIAAATERGIMVINTPDAPTESTAEHAIALMLCLTKGVMTGDRWLHAGKGFPPLGTIPPGLEALGATLALVGLGRIGSRVAQIARVLGMRVLAYDPYVPAERAQSLGVEMVGSLDELWPQADVVSLHVPPLPETYRMINAETLAKMRRGVFLVNVARGGLIDEAALLEALRSGQVAAAGLDVFDPEPPDPNNPLLQEPNVVCTSHVGSYTSAGLLKMQVQSADQIAQMVRGERPSNLVNPEVWGKHRG